MLDTLAAAAAAVLAEAGDGRIFCGRTLPRLRAQARVLLLMELRRTEGRAGSVGSETSRRLGDGPRSSRTPGETDGPAAISGRSCAMSVDGVGFGDGVGDGGDGSIMSVSALVLGRLDGRR